jgi:uncharacterized membrane protein
MDLYKSTQFLYPLETDIVIVILFIVFQLYNFTPLF